MITDLPVVEGLSVRERLALHRAMPACAGCHNFLDPAGLGFEEFDGIGKQITDGSVDASGGLPDGRTYTGARELALLLENDPAVTKCLTGKLMTYAMGRELDAADTEEAARLADELAASNGSLAQLLGSIASSPAFIAPPADVLPGAGAVQ